MCQDTCVSYAKGMNVIHGATCNGSILAALYPCDPLLPPENLLLFQPHITYNGSPTHHTAFELGVQPCIPLNKPLEVETLLNSKIHFVPLLLWLSHSSGLVLCNLPQEYAYLCMELFFISELCMSFRYLTLAITDRMDAASSGPSWHHFHYWTHTRTHENSRYINHEFVCICSIQTDLMSLMTKQSWVNLWILHCYLFW